jgi:hypothetical protein
MGYFNHLHSALDELPKTKESEIWRTDPAVYSFINFIMRQRVDDKSLLPVIDEMFIYYTNVNKEMREELLHIKQRLTPADLARLYEGYTTNRIVNQSNSSAENPTNEKEKE